MIGWTGLAPWEFEFPFPGSLTSTFLAPANAGGGRLTLVKITESVPMQREGFDQYACQHAHPSTRSSAGCGRSAPAQKKLNASGRPNFGIRRMLASRGVPRRAVEEVAASSAVAGRMAHIRQSRPDYGLGFQGESPENFSMCSLFARTRNVDGGRRQVPRRARI